MAVECKFWKSHAQQRHVIRDHCVTEAEGVTLPYANPNRVSSHVSLVLNLTRLQTRVGRFKLHPQGPAPLPRPASTPLAPACWVNAPAHCIGASDPVRWVNARAYRVSTPSPARCVDAPSLYTLGQRPLLCALCGRCTCVSAP